MLLPCVCYTLYMMKDQSKQTALTASAIIAALALSHFTAEEYTAMADIVRQKRLGAGQKILNQLCRGDKVRFTTAKRGTITGTVTKIGTKNVQIMTETSGIWRVAATLLEVIR